MNARLHNKLLRGFIAVFFCILFVFTVQFASAENGTKEICISDIITERSGVSEVEPNFDFLSIHNVGGSPVGRSEKGLAIFADNGGGVKFSYKNIIDLNGFDGDVPFIEFLPYIGDGFSSLESITLTLTDTDNPDNVISVYVYSYPTNHAVYSRVGYADKSLGASSEGSDKIWDGKYGAYIRGLYFEKQFYSNGKWIDVNTIPCAVYFDAEEKTISLGSGSAAGEKTVVLDLDNPAHVGKGFEWSGFVSDVKLSVTLGFKETKRGCVIMKSIVGVNLEGNVTDENSKLVIPKIVPVVDSLYAAELPVGAVNVDYPIPGVKASDVYYGQEQSVSYEIKRLVGEAYEVCEKKKHSDANGNIFVPQFAGNYKIVYYAENEIGSGSYELPFKVAENKKPIVVVLTETAAAPELFQTFRIPETYAYGGSGRIIKTESLLYNGKPVELPDDRTIKIDAAGVITLIVSCSDYLGKAADRTFEFSTAKNIAISVSDMPLIIRKGEKLVLPEGSAFSPSGEKVAVKIFADGKELSDDRVLTTDEESGKIKVEYKAAENAVKTFFIKIIGEENVTPKDMFVNGAGDLELDDTNRGVKVNANADGTITYGYTAVTGAASSKLFIILSATTENSNNRDYVVENNYQYIDIILSDVKNEYKDAFIRVYSKCDEGTDKAYLQINGVGEKYVVNGGLNGTLPLRLYISNNALYNDYTKTCICPIGAYAAELSKVSFNVGEVTGKASFYINKFGNVNLNYSGGEWSDVNVPVISFSEELPRENKAYKGKDFRIPSAAVYDLQSHGAKLKLTIKTPDGATLMTCENLTDGLSFKLTQAGNYKIIFGLKDADNGWKNETYTVSVRETTSPDLNIEKLFKSELPVNTKIIMPKATATRQGESFEVFSYIKSFSDGKIYYVKEGEEYIFGSAGTYSVTWFTHDADYNYTSYTQIIEVK